MLLMAQMPGKHIKPPEKPKPQKEVYTKDEILALVGKMVYVEGGTFQMGATPEQGNDAYDDEKPVHSVTLSSFSIAETEVTQALWEAVMGSNPSYHKGSKRPVENVTWEDICGKDGTGTDPDCFLYKLNQMTDKQYRLPTEAEWEYAARGGNKSRGYKYSGSNTLDEVAWYIETINVRGTRDVKTKVPNELGLYDMSGNVCEWCQDWLGDYSNFSQTNPTGPALGSIRVSRGGGWEFIAKFCRVAQRFRFPSGRRYAYLGLRLAL